MKYELLLGLRYRVDSLENILFPETEKLPSARIDRWKVIFKHKENNFIIQELCSKLEKCDMSESLFCRTVGEICRDSNVRSAHIVIPLPYPVTDETIIEAWRNRRLRNVFRS